MGQAMPPGRGPAVGQGGSAPVGWHDRDDGAAARDVGPRAPSGPPEAPAAAQPGAAPAGPSAAGAHTAGGARGGGPAAEPAAFRPYWAVASFALPMLATLAADPVASLVDTAFVGHLGAAQLAGVGTAMSIYNAVTKMFNASLLAVVTSQVAAAVAVVAAKAAAAGTRAGGGRRGRRRGPWAVVIVEDDLAEEEEEEEEGEEDEDEDDQEEEGRQQERAQELEGLGLALGHEGRRSPPEAAQPPPPLTVRVPAPPGGAARVHAAGNGGGGSLRGGSCAASVSSSPSGDAIMVIEGGSPPAGWPSPPAAAAGGARAAKAAWVWPGSDERGGGSGGGEGEEEEEEDFPPAVERSQPSGIVTVHSRGVSGQEVAVATSTALALALAFGALEAAILVAGGPRLAGAWGAAPGSSLRAPALAFLLVRGATAPAAVLLLVLQGVFRGLQDASTPLYATLLCNAVNLGLEYPFIFKPLGLGAAGSALATSIAQAVALLALLAALQRQHGLGWHLKLVDWGHLGAMFKPTGFMVVRSACVSAVYAAAMAVASRAGPTAAAAHQVALQLWLSSSLMADALAAAAQALVAAEVAAGRPRRARALVRAASVLAMGLGLLLGAALWLGLEALPALFTADPEVLLALRPLMFVVAATQPLNAAAFVLDGVLYGAGGFRYASAMMLPCAAASLAVMIAGARRAAAAGEPPEAQLLWVWAGLAVLMALRIVGVGAPLLLRRYPLGCLYSDRTAARRAAAAARRAAAAAAGGGPRGWWRLAWLRWPVKRRAADLEAPLLQAPHGG